MNRTFSALLLTVMLASPAALAADALPGGATSLREVYDNWVLSCGLQKADAGSRVACVFSVEQVNTSTRKRVVAMAVSAVNGGIKGSLLMPFGLNLQKGVTLQVDDGAVTVPIPFRTCTAQGCVIPLDWAADSVAVLRQGTSLTVGAVTDPGEALNLALPLKGFGPAFDRAVELTK